MMDLKPYLMNAINESYIQDQNKQIALIQNAYLTGDTSTLDGVDLLLINATKEWIQIQSAHAQELAYYVALSASIVTYIFLTINWLFLLKQFKKKLLQYRRGFYIEKPEKRLQNSSHYFGFQVVSTIVGGVLLYTVFTIAFFLIGFSITNKDIRIYLLKLVLPTGTAYLLIALPISLIESYVITKKDGKEIKKNYLFYIADCFFLAMHLLRGIILMPVRALLSLLLLALYIPRLDSYVFPGEFKIFDWGSIAFNGMVYMEHKYNNPVALVFREVLRKEIKTSKVLSPQQQARRNLQTKILQTVLIRQNPALKEFTKSAVTASKKAKIEFIRRAKEQLSEDYADYTSSITATMRNVTRTSSLV